MCPVHMMMLTLQVYGCISVDLALPQQKNKEETTDAYKLS